MPIIVNSKFNNLTYDEITQPLEKVTKAHNEVMEQYMQDASTVDMLANTLNPELDKEALAILQEHQAKNENAVNELMAKGLTPNTRALVLDLQKDANTRVSGVAMASATRQEIGKQQSQLLLQHPDLMFRHKANELSLDTIMANPNENYNEAIDLNKVSEEAAKLVTAMSQNDVKLYLEQGKYKNALPAIVEKLGWSYDDIQNKLKDPKNRHSALNIALDEIRKQTGVDNWGDANATANVQYAIERGAKWAVGKTQKQLYQPKEKSFDLGSYVDEGVMSNRIKPARYRNGDYADMLYEHLPNGEIRIFEKHNGQVTRDDNGKEVLAQRAIENAFKGEQQKEFYNSTYQGLAFEGSSKNMNLVPTTELPDMTGYTLEQGDFRLWEDDGNDTLEDQLTQYLANANWSDVHEITVKVKDLDRLLKVLNEKFPNNQVDEAKDGQRTRFVKSVNSLFNKKIQGQGSIAGMDIDDFVITLWNGSGWNNGFLLQTENTWANSVHDYSKPKQAISGVGKR